MGEGFVFFRLRRGLDMRWSRSVGLGMVRRSRERNLA
jgi:hypothetical protein